MNFTASKQILVSLISDIFGLIISLIVKILWFCYAPLF